MSDEIRRVSGTKYANIVCKFCAHGKTWHSKDGPCRYDINPRLGACDCEVWDYGTNVEAVKARED